MWHSTGETGQTQTDNPRLTQKQLSNDTIKKQSHFLIFPVYLILTFMSADISHKRQTNNALRCKGAAPTLPYTPEGANWPVV